MFSALTVWRVICLILVSLITLLPFFLILDFLMVIFFFPFFFRSLYFSFSFLVPNFLLVFLVTVLFTSVTPPFLLRFPTLFDFFLVGFALVLTTVLDLLLVDFLLEDFAFFADLLVLAFLKGLTLRVLLFFFFFSLSRTLGGLLALALLLPFTADFRVLRIDLVSG